MLVGLLRVPGWCAEMPPQRPGRDPADEPSHRASTRPKAVTAGRDYPRSYAALRAWFDEDWKCLDYLDWLRWPNGFVCPHCGCDRGWRAPDLRWRCAGCDRRVSATAGTILHGTRTPLTVWFAAAWHLVNSKVGIFATQLKREMELGY